MAKCSRCHEADGSSLTASAQAEKDLDLRNAFFQRNVDDIELRHIMEFGKGRMQGVTGLSPAMMDSIVLHVRRLGGHPDWKLDRAAGSE
jgi:cytochrome c553